MSNKNPSFLRRGCFLQGSENGPHCDHVDRPERPEFLPQGEKAEFLGRKEFPPASCAPPKLCPREARARVITDPETSQALCWSPEHPRGALLLLRPQQKDKAPSVCLSPHHDWTHHYGKRPERVSSPGTAPPCPGLQQRVKSVSGVGPASATYHFVTEASFLTSLYLHLSKG